MDDEPIDGAEIYQATLHDIGSSYMVPQKARWRIGADSGAAGLYHLGLKVITWVDLDTIPRDTVWIEYWRAGVQEQRSAFLFKGTARLEWSGLSLVDSVVIEFLRRIDPSTDSSRFDTAFAQALVDNDSIFLDYGFPRNFPVGLDTAEILRIAMVLMVRKEQALAQIAPKSDWALGIDTLAVHVRVRLLCEEGIVTDTSKIFPHVIVGRDTTKPDTGIAKPDTGASDTTVTDTTTTPIDTIPAVDRPDTLAPDLRVVDPAAGSVFEFFRDTIEVRILATDTSGVDSVKVNDRHAVRRDSLWVIEKLYVPMSPDSLVLFVEAWDGAKNRSTARIQVRRKKAPLPEEPYHAILLPVASTVPFDSTSVLARWIVYDPTSQVDSVRIGGIKAVYEKDSIWSARVRLDSIGTPTTIRFVATTAKGASIADSIEITRRKDSTGPSILLVSPADKQDFGYTTESVTISVTATDPSGVASVNIAGVVAPDSGGSYRRSVELAMGETDTFAIEARDSAGNLSRLSITLTRKAPPDTLPPKIARVWPVSKTGTMVPFDSQSVTLRWVVTDLFGLHDTSVRIAGSVVDGVSDTFALRVLLPPNGVMQNFPLHVVNVKGVSITDTVSLARAKDTVRPVLVRKAGSRKVPSDSVSVIASWEVSDNHKLSWVAIDDDTVSGVGGIYRKSIDLDTGRNLVVVAAMDSSGNRSDDTIEVVRIWRDTTKPVIERGEGARSRTIGFDIGEVGVSWKVTDDSPVEVTINDVVIAGSGGIYTTEVQLSGTVTTVAIVAKDSAGNTSMDTITITKSADLEPPKVVATLETRSRTVEFGTDSIWVGWTVQDNSVVGVVKIAGEIVRNPTDSAYVRKVPLVAGDNVIRIEARDQAGNSAYDSVVIHRLAAPAQVRILSELVAPFAILERPHGPTFRFPRARRERIFG